MLTESAKLFFPVESETDVSFFVVFNIKAHHLYMFGGGHMNEKEIIKQILKLIKPSADFENVKTIVDDGLLDSLQFMNLVSELVGRFGIEINIEDIVPENFNSIESIEAMVKRLRK